MAKRLEERIAVSKRAYKNGADATKPDAASVEEIITTAFWASLRREEGHSPRISIAFVPPEQSLRPLQFSPRVRLDATLLSRIAPAVEKPGIHIGVWSYEGDLYAWGVTRTVPIWCFILEVIKPGLLVVKYRRDDPSAKFANIAVLDGAVVKFIEQEPAAMSEAPPALGSLLAFYSSAGRNESDNILVRVAIAMRTSNTPTDNARIASTRPTMSACTKVSSMAASGISTLCSTAIARARSSIEPASLRT